MNLVISPLVSAKLAQKDPPVSLDDIVQCFANRTGEILTDTRPKNLTNPLTNWFISITDYGRKLKVCFIPLVDGRIVIRTAYVPDRIELAVYRKYGE